MIRAVKSKQKIQLCIMCIKMKRYVMLSRLYHPVDLVCKANTIKDPIRIPVVLRIADTSEIIQYH